MVSVCFYFQVHQPYRIRHYPVFDIGSKHDYFSESTNSKLNNKQVLNKVAEKCYLPANKLVLELIKKHPEFKVSYSISGVILDQFKEFNAEVLKSFQDLVKTGNVELLNETYYHSLAYLFSKEEFKDQVKLHKKTIQKLFNYTPKIFRNTELIFNNEFANFIEKMGYKGILAEGSDHILGWRSPNFIYTPKTTKNLKLMLRNYKLSDDISFRFSERSWKEWPLNAEKYSKWVSANNGNGNVINLFMDYETFGEHQWKETGIFQFMEALVKEILKHPDNDFKTISEAMDSYPSVGELDIHNFMSWADIERDLSAWLSNAMQHSAIQNVYNMRDQVLKTNNNELINTWRKLQTSDHFYYMCTKWFSDGDVHKYFNPYESPYEAFISYMNVLNDLRLKVSDNLRENQIKSSKVIKEKKGKYKQNKFKAKKRYTGKNIYKDRKHYDSNKKRVKWVKM